jgi:hypothetical protein
MAEQFEFSGIDLKPEAKLLLCCARTQMESVNAERILALLQDHVDWSYLIQIASHHHVAPLLHNSLEAVAPNTIPGTVQAEFKKRVQVSVQGNLFLLKELLHLLGLFGKHELPVIPYKGPVLASSVYGNLALRPFNDLDILVHEWDVLRAMDLLVSCGYQVIRPAIVAEIGKDFQPAHIQQLVEKSPWAYQLVFWHPDRRCLVELHWRILPRYIFPNNPEELWENLELVTLGGDTVLSFAPENLLWFLCVHGAKHQWKRLSWLCDIAELVRAYPHLNWEQVVAQAAKSGIERRLSLGLHLANYLLEAPLPETIKTKLHTSQHVKALAQQVIEGIFDGMEQKVRYPYLERFAFQMRAMDRMVDRGKYLLRFANVTDIVV